MVDRADLTRVLDLYREWNALNQCIINLDAGGRINSMIVVGPPSTPPHYEPGEPIPPDPYPAAIVPTPNWPYPPAMKEGIKQIAIARQDEITEELANYGLTGLTVAPR